MKFTANRTNLLEALTVTGKAIGTNILPILSSYLLKIDNNTIEVTGGSMDLFIKQSIEILPCGETRSIAVPKNKLFDLIKDSPSQPIQFEVLENNDLAETVIHLKVTTSIGEYLIPIESGDNYPFLKIENSESFELSKEHLTQGIDATLFACGDDALRPHFTGVFVNFEAGKISFTATNGFVVSTKSFTNTEIANNNGFIVPQKALSILQSATLDEVIKVMVAKNHIKFSLSDTLSIESILIDAKFPDYKSVIPTNHQNHVSIRKIALQGSVKRVSPFADAGTTQLEINIKSSKCMISSHNDLGDKAEEHLDLEAAGADLRIGISGKLLAGCLTKINTDNVSVSYQEPNQAMVFRDSNDDTVVNSSQNLILIMPMILNK